jgi:hypothetical protein
MTEHLITSMVVTTNTEGATLHVTDDAYDQLLEHGWRPPVEAPSFHGELEYEAVQLTPGGQGDRHGAVAA